MNITVLHHTAIPDNDGDAGWLNYTVYILVGITPKTVEFTSYFPLNEEQIKTKANEQLLHRAPSI
jgi:hypothetical protein